MGQALEMCVNCENKRGCDTCTDLHNWIMEHLDAKQEWISVKDRMPERNELVLVCAASTARGGKIRFVGAYDGFWFLQTAADTIGLTIQYDVTHWMPLPEPPKEE